MSLKDRLPSNRHAVNEPVREEPEEDLEPEPEAPRVSLQPPSRAEAEERLAALGVEVAKIDQQLHDPSRQHTMSAAQFFDWRSRALKAKAHMEAERILLQRWIRELVAKQQKVIMQGVNERKQEKLRRYHDLMARSAEIRETITAEGLAGPVAHLSNLFCALRSYVNRAGLPMTETEQVFHDLARTYLEDIGLIRPPVD